MNGPEHYREAERLLQRSMEMRRGDVEEASVFAEAQVHATLALAAATALGTAGVALDGPTAQAWRKTIAQRPGESS